MFAVIKTGGKQYKVAVGDVLSIEKLEAEAGSTVTFDTVLMHGGDGGVTVGSPLVDGAVVTGEILEQYRGKKVIAFKKRRRKHSSATRKGHRQSLTLVRIQGVPGDADGSAAKAAKPAKAAPAAEASAAPSGTKPGNLIDGAVTDGDDLSKLPGIGEVTGAALNEIGVHHYSQFTDWGPSDWEFIENYIDDNVKGTIEINRASIVVQANKLIETRAAASEE